MLAGVPAAVAGSIALSLTAVPAHAEARAASPSQAMPVKAPRTAPAALPASAAAASGYIVQPGDTVSAIASRHGVRTADLLALNSLAWSSVIYPGQELVLSGGLRRARSDRSDLRSFAHRRRGRHHQRHRQTARAQHRRRSRGQWTGPVVDHLPRSDPRRPRSRLGACRRAGARPGPAPAPVGGAYTIAAGDTISAIATRHGVSIDAVLGANGLDRSSIIYPGQTLAIPVAAVAASAPVVSGLDAEQAANAQLIVRVGRDLGVPDRGIAIALGTAMQESWIRNLDWGDRDSLGLFQQRPSTGWGTEAEVRDPVHSIKAFFGGAHDPNGSRTRGLLDIAGWQSMSFADAAQAVQVSAYPDRYAQWEAPAHAWLAALG